MKFLKMLILACTALLLLACGKPVPDDKSAYVGLWKAQSMTLLITQDGRVGYQRMEKGVSKSIEGPLQEFQGNNFIVGFGPIKTTFIVSAPPHEEEGDWKMTVDGVVLTRVDQ